MKKIIELFWKKDVGVVGIGAMIVFIAMVLVAGIAASVLIQTSGKLETQAMQSGQQTIDEVASGLAVFDIVGKKSTDVRYLAITVRPRAGTPDIDLNESVLVISDEIKKVVLIYNGWTDAGHYESSVATATGRLFATDTWTDLTSEEFGIIVLQDQDSSCTQTNPVINKGDKVVLTVQCWTTVGAFSREIPERTNVFGKVIPEVGSPGVISFKTPASYSNTLLDLQ